MDADLVCKQRHLDEAAGTTSTVAMESTVFEPRL